MIVAVAGYLLFVKYGTAMMKDRKPFDLKYFMHAYNLGLVLLSVYMTKEVSTLKDVVINCRLYKCCVFKY